MNKSNTYQRKISWWWAYKSTTGTGMGQQKSSSDRIRWAFTI